MKAICIALLLLLSFAANGQSANNVVALPVDYITIPKFIGKSWKMLLVELPKNGYFKFSKAFHGENNNPVLYFLSFENEEASLTYVVEGDEVTMAMLYPNKNIALSYSEFVNGSSAIVCHP